MRNEKGNVIKVSFGDTTGLDIKEMTQQEEAFRTRHNCDNPGQNKKQGIGLVSFGKKVKQLQT